MHVAQAYINTIPKPYLSSTVSLSSVNLAWNSYGMYA